MTRSLKTPVSLMLALTVGLGALVGPTLADTRTTARLETSPPAARLRIEAPSRPKGLVAAAPGQAQADNDTFCGNGEQLVIYDEDANGNPVPGTEVYGCVYD